METLEGKVIYHIYPKSFADSNDDGIGDLNGIIEKLDYIKTLGVDYIWLSPINKSPQRDNGYDISDYYEIDPIFGSLSDFKNLVDKCHDQGLKVMMDLVLNHTSIAHQWFRYATDGKQHYQDFYYFRDTPTDLKSVFGGSAWSYVPELNKYYLCYFDKSQADLNWDNKYVREELFKMVNFWIEQGVDGFRLDVINHISKDIEQNIVCNGPNLAVYLSELNSATFGSAMLTVGECWNADSTLMRLLCHNQGLTQAFHFSDLSHTFGQNKWEQTPFDLAKLADQLNYWHNTYTGISAWATGSHDLPRMISLWLDDKKYRYASATLLITVYAMLRGNLYIYQGDEIGVTNAYQSDITLYQDIESVNAFNEMRSKGMTLTDTMAKIMLLSRDNARGAMAWNGEENGGFSSRNPWLWLNANHEEINVNTDLQSSTSIYRYYKTVLELRKKCYSLLKQDTTITANETVLIIKRSQLTVLANFSDREVSIDEPTEDQVIFINNYNLLYKYKLNPYQVVVFHTPSTRSEES